jgi:toxin ParE1/3/4
LDAIVEYIALRNGVAAFALRDRIEAAVLPLSEHPYLFRAGRVAGTREIVAHPNYIVVYQVLEREVIISDVLHARQRYP